MFTVPFGDYLDSSNGLMRNRKLAPRGRLRDPGQGQGDRALYQ